MNKSILPNTAANLRNNGRLFQRVTLFVIWAWLIIFALIPNILVVLASFLTRDEDKFLALPVTIDNYLRFVDPLYVKVFLHSLSMASVTTIICLLLGYPFAWLVSRTSKRWQSFLMLLLIIPFWTNSLVRLYAVKLIMAANGLLTDLRQDIVLASKDLGANKFQTFWHVILPLTTPGIISGVLLVLLPAMGMFYVADILGGSRNLLVGNIIKSQFLDARDWPFGAAASVLLTLTMAILIAAYYASSKRIGKTDHNEVA